MPNGLIAYSSTIAKSKQRLEDFMRQPKLEELVFQEREQEAIELAKKQ